MNNTGTDTGTNKACYLELADRLRRSIREGSFKPGDRLGSEHSLARREEISRMTVRRASEILVGEGLLERRPGKGLFVRGKHSATRAVKVVVGNLQWEPAIQAARGIRSIGSTLGIDVQLYDAHGDPETDLAMLARLPETTASGAIIVSLHSKAFNEAIYDLKRQRYPFVLIDQRLQDIDIPSVSADNYAGGYAAGQHLLEHGHKRIGFVGDFVANTVQDRLAGFRDAVADAGHPLDRSLLIDLGKDDIRGRLDDWSEQVDACTRRLMDRPDPPTAVFFSCDAIARSGCKTLAAMGLSVPGDVSVIGFDDDPLCQWMTPALSSIRQPFFEMGEAAIRMLVGLMTNPGRAPQSLTMSVSLVPRGTVATPRQTLSRPSSES